jgi:hypothetical protein
MRFSNDKDFPSSTSYEPFTSTRDRYNWEKLEILKLRSLQGSLKGIE